MKKFIFYLLSFLLCLTTVLCPVVVSGKADGFSLDTGRYAYVPTDAVYFYDLPTRQGLFCLPKTYYVKILDEDSDYYQIEYLTDTATTKRLVGYCKKGDVLPVDYVPQTPYLFTSFDVTYTLDGSDGTQSDFYKLTFSCTYYGTVAKENKLYAYVLKDGIFGYVLRPSDFSYPLNNEYAERQSANPETDETQDRDALSGAQIALIALLCLLIPSVSALILRTQRKESYGSEESSL